MEELHKIGIDLLFCLILGLLTLQASKSINENQQLSEALTQESARITINYFK
jgi:hypothetical protein